VIISHKNKFIFIKSRKTAGSSVQLALFDYCGSEDVVTGSGLSKLPRKEFEFPAGAHQNLSYIKYHLGENIWKKYFTFAFVRNPWDLAVSRFFFEQYRGRTSIQDFNEWVKQSKMGLWDKDELAQFTHDEYTGTNELDFVGRYESLEKDFGFVCEKLGVPIPNLPHSKKRGVKKEHYSIYYNDASIQFVAEKQQRAIKAFDYRFEAI
jgi:hypothetical protein